MNKQEGIRELGAKILAVCARCPHGRWFGGTLQCSVKRAHCHSQRVRRWLAEIEKLES